MITNYRHQPPRPSAADQQWNFKTLAEAYKRAQIVTNVTETNVLILESNQNSIHPFLIASDKLISAPQFTHLGSILTMECNAYTD